MKKNPDLWKEHSFTTVHFVPVSDGKKLTFVEVYLSADDGTLASLGGLSGTEIPITTTLSFSNQYFTLAQDSKSMTLRAISPEDNPTTPVVTHQ